MSTPLVMRRIQLADHRALRADLLRGLPPAAADWRIAPQLPTLGWHLLHAAWVHAAVVVAGDGGDAPEIGRRATRCTVGCPVPADGAVGDLPAVMDEVAALESLADARVATWHGPQWDAPLPAVDPVLLSSPGQSRLEAMATMVTHDAYHLGQVAVIRRVMGLAHLE